MKKVTEIQYAYNFEAVEKVEELITAGVLYVERECRHNVRLSRSKEIHEIMIQANILQLYMSIFQNKVDCTDQIEKKQHTLKVKQYITKTIKDTKELIKMAKKAGTNTVERLSIQINNIIGGPGRGIHSKLSQYVSLENSKNLQKLQSQQQNLFRIIDKATQRR